MPPARCRWLGLPIVPFLWRDVHCVQNGAPADAEAAVPLIYSSGQAAVDYVLAAPGKR